MAGRPKSRAANDAYAQTYEFIREDYDRAIGLIGTFMPTAVRNLMELANGVTVQETKVNKKGEASVIVYTKPPDLFANRYLLDRVMGSPRVEKDKGTAELDNARADLIRAQIKADLPAIQARELAVRAEGQEMEKQMWNKSFVTEEQQQDMIQRIAQVVNSALLSLTPEQFREIVEGRDHASALEELKGRLGKSQALIVSEVMSEGFADEEEEDE